MSDVLLVAGGVWVCVCVCGGRRWRLRFFVFLAFFGLTGACGGRTENGEIPPVGPAGATGAVPPVGPDGVETPPEGGATPPVVVEALAVPHASASTRTTSANATRNRFAPCMGVGIGSGRTTVEARPRDLAIFPSGARYGRPVIVVGGEALYDLVARDDGTIEAHPGGGPFNTARAIGRLEQPVAFLGRLSTDRFGKNHARILDEDGVDLSPTLRSDDPTTLALAEIDAQGHAAYRFYARGTASVSLTGADIGLPARVDILHVGTLGLVFEPIASALEAALEAVHGSALVALDPNCRPAAIADEPGYRARLGRILGRTHLLKLSEDDLAWLAPERPLHELGPSVVLLTRGAAGATVISHGRETAVEAPHVDVVDTIGAGDAFGGGFLAWWHSHGLGRHELRDHDLVVEGARYAARVAAVTCSRAGADPPRLADLDT